MAVMATDFWCLVSIHTNKLVAEVFESWQDSLIMRSILKQHLSGGRDYYGGLKVNLKKAERCFGLHA